MNAEEREVLARIDRLAQELLDKDWLERGVSQEELDQSRLSTQQMNAALDQGYSMDEVLRMFDCTPADETPEEKPVQQLRQPDIGAERPVKEPLLSQINAGTIL